MKKMIKGIIALGAGMSLMGSLSTTAAASSQYSASRSNSVRLIWQPLLETLGDLVRLQQQSVRCDVVYQCA
ncbi:hypothetical protein [Levilactobacillus fujinensis]|uniref:Uncharacterized protein n=1 Tax=Levilactobacillus fujinensis TaxID=2486024 RepID=A0ABW1TD86_9LACO|nr:hypothetical protein [Levilactobacillus fujinensis]